MSPSWARAVSRFLLHITDKCKHFLVLPQPPPQTSHVWETRPRHGQPVQPRQGRGVISTPGTGFLDSELMEIMRMDLTHTHTITPNCSNHLYSSIMYRYNLVMPHIFWPNLITAPRSWKVQLSQLLSLKGYEGASQWALVSNHSSPLLTIKTSLHWAARCAGRRAVGGSEADKSTRAPITSHFDKMMSTTIYPHHHAVTCMWVTPLLSTLCHYSLDILTLLCKAQCLQLWLHSASLTQSQPEPSAASQPRQRAPALTLTPRLAWTMTRKYKTHISVQHSQCISYIHKPDRRDNKVLLIDKKTELNLMQSRHWCWLPLCFLLPAQAGCGPVYHWRAHAPDLTEHEPGLLLLLLVVNGLEPSLELWAL